jgi:hypothetical protein
MKFAHFMMTAVCLIALGQPFPHVVPDHRLPPMVDEGWISADYGTIFYWKYISDDTTEILTKTSPAETDLKCHKYYVCDNYFMNTLFEQIKTWIYREYRSTNFHCICFTQFFTGVFFIQFEQVSNTFTPTIITGQHIDPWIYHYYHLQHHYHQ